MTGPGASAPIACPGEHADPRLRRPPDRAPASSTRSVTRSAGSATSSSPSASPARRPRVIGLVVEVAGRRRVFVPMTRVTSVEGGQVITTGLVNMRRFEQRGNETLVVAELFERPVQVRTDEGEVVDATVEDVGIEQHGTARLGRRPGLRAHRRRSRGGLGPARPPPRRDAARAASRTSSACASPPAPRAPTRLLEAYEDLKPADLAEVIHDLSPQRRAEVAAALDDDRLADVIEELPEDDQVEILAGLAVDRAADVLEAMEPDDAADLLAELPKERQEELLQKMEPDEAADLRRLLTYDENTAGGLMTTEPVILGPGGVDRRGAGRRAPGRAVDRAGLAPSSSAAPRWRPPPVATSAWSTSSGCSASPRTRRSAASSTRTSSRCRPTRIPGPGDPDARDLRPGRPAGRRRRGPPARRGHRRRRPRPHPPRGLARGPPRRRDRPRRVRRG